MFSVLCVDDSAYNLFVLEELFSEICPLIKVDTALNGQIAIDKYLKYNIYDYILLDLNMPVLNGF